MKRVLVIAPHPDDETLGCGATLLRHREAGDSISWLIATDIDKNSGYSPERIQLRETEISNVAKAYGFTAVRRLGFSTARLDEISVGDIVTGIGSFINEIEAEIVYLPYPGDVHTDHGIVFCAGVSCAKSFRYKTVKRVLAYETLSETDFGLNPDSRGFKPNVYCEVTPFIEEKIRIMNIFRSEVGVFPFPRSEQAIRSLAALRGAAANCEAAEAFMLLKEIL